MPAIDDSLKRLQEAACERCRGQTGWRFDSNQHDHSRLIVMAQLLSRQRFNLMQFFYCSFRNGGNTCQSWGSFTDDMSRLHHKVHYSYSAKATDWRASSSTGSKWKLQEVSNRLDSNSITILLRKKMSLSVSGFIQAPAATIILMDPVGSLSN